MGTPAWFCAKLRTYTVMDVRAGIFFNCKITQSDRVCLFQGDRSAIHMGNAKQRAQHSSQSKGDPPASQIQPDSSAIHLDSAAKFKISLSSEICVGVRQLEQVGLPQNMPSTCWGSTVFYIAHLGFKCMLHGREGKTSCKPLYTNQEGHLSRNPSRPYS